MEMFKPLKKNSLHLKEITTFFYLFKGNKGKLDGLRTCNAFKQQSCVMGNGEEKSAPRQNKISY